MNNVEVLDKDACFALLSTTDIGRFAVISGRYPVVFPVNFILDKGVITFRTAQGLKLRAALHNDISFESDGVSSDRSFAWSVLVFGNVDHDGISIDGLERREQLDVHPIDSSDKPAWVRINVHQVTGRRFANKDANNTPAFDEHAYL